MHPGVRRALEQGGRELSQRVVRSRGPHLYRAVSEILNCSPEAESLSLLYHPPAVAYSLYPADDAVVGSLLSRLVQVRHLLIFATGSGNQRRTHGKDRATG